MTILRQQQGQPLAVGNDWVQPMPQPYTATIQVHTATRGTVDLAALVAEATAPGPLAQQRLHQHHLQTILDLLHQQHQAAQRDHQRHAQSLTASSRALQQRLAQQRASTPRQRFTQRLQGLVVSPATQRKHLELTVTAHWDAYARASAAGARVQALARAIQQVDYAVQQMTDDTSRLAQGLAAAVDDLAIAADWVGLAPVEEVHRDLRRAIRQATLDAEGRYSAHEWAKLQPPLLRTIRYLTLPALAHMLHVDAEPHAIVQALQAKHYAYEAPMWEGQPVPSERPAAWFLVLPPLAVNDLEALRQAAQECHLKPTLITTADVLAGGCIVELAFYRVRDQREVLPPIYGAGAEAPETSPSTDVPGVLAPALPHGVHHNGHVHTAAAVQPAGATPLHEPVLVVPGGQDGVPPANNAPFIPEEDAR